MEQRTGRANRGTVLRGVVVVTALAIALAACGRRGPLEHPPGAPKPPPPASGEVIKPGPRPVNPDRPFILDGIL